jgi:hypothetical protein
MPPLYTTAPPRHHRTSRAGPRHARGCLAASEIHGGKTMKNTTDDDLKKELLELETKYWNAIKEQDSETVLQLSADTCIVTGAQGVGQLEKQRLAGMLEQPSYELRDFRIEDVKMQKLSDDVAVLAYKVHEDLVVDGAPVTLDAADASTWVRKNGSWVFGRDRGTRVDAPN